MGYNPWGRKESDTTERLLCVCVCVCVCQCLEESRCPRNMSKFIVIYLVRSKEELVKRMSRNKGSIVKRKLR